MWFLFWCLRLVFVCDDDLLRCIGGFLFVICLCCCYVSLFNCVVCVVGFCVGVCYVVICVWLCFEIVLVNLFILDFSWMFMIVFCYELGCLFVGLSRLLCLFLLLVGTVVCVLLIVLLVSLCSSIFAMFGFKLLIVCVCFAWFAGLCLGCVYGCGLVCECVRFECLLNVIVFCWLEGNCLLVGFCVV